MSPQVLAIANEFDSYLQDRAKRLGYTTRWPAPGAGRALPESGRFALVGFQHPGWAALCDALAAPGVMQAYHDRGHFIAWTDQPGALVQMNVYRKEVRGGDDAGVASRLGVRAFAEQFFCDPHGRSLALCELREYLGWLAEKTGGVAESSVALMVLQPRERELALIRLPSVAALEACLKTATPG